jgi:nicotinamide-nucleotide amidase
MPRLRARGLGQERITRTYRLTGIGESTVADILGEPLLRAANPIVATYARADAVDVRISAIAEPDRPAATLVAETEAVVLAALGRYVWGRDDDTWPAVLGRDLAALGWTAALAELGTGGATTRLFGDAEWLKAAQVFGPKERGGSVTSPTGLAEQIRLESGADVGLAVRAVDSGEDTHVELALSGPSGNRESVLTAFLGGAEGRRRAGIAAAAFLHAYAREAAQAPDGQQPGAP